MAKKLFNSGVSEKTAKTIHEMYERKLEPITISKYTGVDLSRVNMEIRNYEHDMESKSYMDRMAATLHAMIF